MIDLEKEETASRLRGSFYDFLKFFTKYITGRDYIESKPIGRESHQITICKELVALNRLEHPDENLLINTPPGSGKSLHVCMWTAWCYTHNPKCNFIYISYSSTLASEQTAFIRLIMSSPMYGYLFGVYLSKDTRAKDHFSTTEQGNVAAFGSEGAITGRNAGLPDQDIFSGAVIIDDPHKPDEAHSDTIREKVIKNYEETIRQRPRGKNVPIVFIGQRVHEADLASFLIEGNDIKPWRKVILKSLDDAGNALYPEVHSKEYLLELQDKSPYVFASQFQQDPTPAGGGIFKPDWLLELDKEPEILVTFITSDTAETDKNYNDATAFGFWGLYEIEVFGRKTGELGLHWIDAVEAWVEPKDLPDLFISFWTECARHKVMPRTAFIEKKSTGVTLISTIKNMQGIQIKEIERGAGSGSKSTRFLEVQPFAASKRVTVTRGARHVKMCKDHIGKITANDTHRRDDLADTFADAIRIALIDKLIYKVDHKATTSNKVMNEIAANMRRQQMIRNNRNGVY